MKKNVCYMLSALLFGAVALVGCSQDATTDLAPAEGQGVTLQLTATMPQPDDSRATFNGVNAIWDEDDYLDAWMQDPVNESSAYYRKHLKFNQVSLSSDKRTAVFQATNAFSWYLSEETMLYIACNETAESTVDYRYISVPENQQYVENGYTNIPLLGKGYVTNYPNTDVNQNIAEINGLKFKNPFAILKIQLQAKEGENFSIDYISLEDANGAVIAGNVKADTNDVLSWEGATATGIKLSCGNVALSSTESTSFLIAVPASDLHTFEQGCKITIRTTTGSITKTTKALGVLKANTIYPTPVLTLSSADIPQKTVIDLSEAGTSNCYIVSKPDSSYKLKATIKGNGFVPEVLSSDGVGTTTTIEPKSALVLWYNCLQTSSSWKQESPVIISSVRCEDGYIYFDTPENFVNGNVVIAAFAEEGVTYDSITVDTNRVIDNATLLWSWHIWAVENYTLDSDAFVVGDYTIMGRNVGALVSKAQIDATTTANERKYIAANAIGNYYQWGNKNPYPSVSDYENYKVPNYGNQLYATPTYTPIVALQETKNGNKDMAEQMFGTQSNIFLDLSTYLTDYTTANMVAMTEQAPYKFMQSSTSNYKYSWTNHIGNAPYTSLQHLWGDATTNDPTDHKKTIYDPCPTGWKLWNDSAYDAIVDAGADTAVIDFNALDDDGNRGYGAIVCGSYFPVTGDGRNPGDFSVDRLKRCGYETLIHFHVSAPNIYASGFWLRKYEWILSKYFTTTEDIAVNPEATNSSQISRAKPVRCIRE